MDLLGSLWSQNLREITAGLPKSLQELPNLSKIVFQNKTTHRTKTFFFSLEL